MTARQLLLTLAAAAALAWSASAGAQSPIRVIDGDTIAVRGTTIRIIGLDAPEMHGRCPLETQMARAARDRLAVLLQDGATIWRRGRDRYGRALAVVHDAAGRDVAQLLVSEGLARAYNGRGPRRGWC